MPARVNKIRHDENQELRDLARQHTGSAIAVLSDMATGPDLPKPAPEPIGSGFFYIYRIFGLGNETLYIGKGSGARLAQQKRRFGFDGEIIHHCKDEATAFRQETRYINKLNPPLNQNRGGGGGFAGRGSSKEEKLMNRIGTKAYAARILYWASQQPHLSAYVDSSKIEDFRTAGYGPRVMVIRG